MGSANAILEISRLKKLNREVTKFKRKASMDCNDLELNLRDRTYHKKLRKKKDLSSEDYLNIISNWKTKKPSLGVLASNFSISYT